MPPAPTNPPSANVQNQTPTKKRKIYPDATPQLELLTEIAYEEVSEDMELCLQPKRFNAQVRRK